MRPAAAAAALVPLALAGGALAGRAAAADGPPLVWKAVIPLPHAAGRIWFSLMHATAR